MAIVEDAGRFAEAAAGLAERAQRVGLVDQHISAVLLADVDEFAERRTVAQHRIDAFQDHQSIAGLVA
jgi:hypothetical protein